MADELRVIWLLAMSLGVACLFGMLAQRIKQSTIIGYLLAGYLIGPNFPGVAVDAYIAKQLASIGITLLMFAIGLDFNWNNLFILQKRALPGALVLSGLSITAGTLLCVCLGESSLAGLVVGLAICVSSTVVVVRVLSDQGLLHTQQGHIIIGWTIIEDLISIFGLLLLPTLAAGAFASSSLPFLTQVSWVIFKICVLGIFIYLIGGKLVEVFLKVISRTRSHELFTLAILASIFLIAISSSHLFGVSLALGAFIAGTIIGQTDMSHQAAANALPLHDTFAVMFFLSVGMLFNPMAVIHNLPLLFGILTILLLLRPFLAFVIIRLTQYPKSVGATVAIASAQIGEYSFILAEEGSKLDILPESAFDVLVASAFITIALNPILFQMFKGYCHEKILPEETKADTAIDSFHPPIRDVLAQRPKAIVIGFGPIGQDICKYLLNKGYQVLIIDRNIDTVSALKEEEGTAIQTLFGDATQAHILEKAHIDKARMLVITTPDFVVAKAIIHVAKELQPLIKIITRSHFKSDALPATYEQGEIPVICDEEAVAEQFITEIDHCIEERLKKERVKEGEKQPQEIKKKN